MQPCEYPGCNKPGQGHHIVYRSSGGLNFPLNYKYLCVEHHNGGPNSPHHNKAIDLQYKREEQQQLYILFPDDTYTLPEIVELIGHDKKRLEKRFYKVKNTAGLYEREEIIRALMGGRLY